MQIMRVDAKIQKTLEIFFRLHAPLPLIIQAIAQHNGTAYLVGGAVRDLLLERALIDIDIEVHGLTMEQLETVLRSFGIINLVGKSYGVLRIEYMPIDWSVPRSDEQGRKPQVHVDPTMGFEAAARRRDVTMNALGINLHTYQLHDPFNGIEDMRNHQLRACDARTFVEDPLRFFRVMQFIGRFAMQPDAQLHDICKRMDISAVSRERIEQECKKLFLLSQEPSRGLRWVMTIGRMHEFLPELAALVAIKQDMRWHPEGDVFEHTMQAVDAAAVLNYESEQEKLIGIYAALCHDLGKVTTTEIKDGVITSYGHELASATVAKQMLKRITHHAQLIDAIVLLVRYHMMPGQLIKQESGDAAFKRLAIKLAPDVCMRQLALLALADMRGRNGQNHVPLIEDMPIIDEFVCRVQQLGIYEMPEPPLIIGKDLLGFIEPGPQLGKLVKELYAVQINEGITDKATLITRAYALIGKKE